jgi:putative tryptophan/tyrosine transport system substrate-binding protein
MRRREFLLTGAAASLPLDVGAQAMRRRIGFLTSASDPGLVETSYLSGFPRGMRDLGYVEGMDFTIEWRFAEGRLERFRDFAAELVDLKVDVIVAGTPTAVPPIRVATSKIPIVMGYSTDPVGNGFIDSLARPGGNVTGLASSQDDAAPKQLELLTTALPNLSRIGLLVDPSSPNSSSIIANAQAAAHNAGVVLVQTNARNAQEIESAFGRLIVERVGAVMVLTGSVTFFNRERIAELAVRTRLPTMFSLREFVVSGGMMSYGESLYDFHRRAASFVDKILKGAQPAELPVQQPTHLFLVINRKTADAIAVTIPQTLLALADEVIE